MNRIELKVEALKAYSLMREMGIPEKELSYKEDPYDFIRNEKNIGKDLCCKVEYAKYRGKRLFVSFDDILKKDCLYVEEGGGKKSRPLSTKEDIDNYIIGTP